MTVQFSQAQLNYSYSSTNRSNIRKTSRASDSRGPGGMVEKPRRHQPTKCEYNRTYSNGRTARPEGQEAL